MIQLTVWYAPGERDLRDRSARTQTGHCTLRGLFHQSQYIKKLRIANGSVTASSSVMDRCLILHMTHWSTNQLVCATTSPFVNPTPFLLSQISFWVIMGKLILSESARDSSSSGWRSPIVLSSSQSMKPPIMAKNASDWVHLWSRHVIGSELNCKGNREKRNTLPYFFTNLHETNHCCIPHSTTSSSAINAITMSFTQQKAIFNELLSGLGIFG